MDGPDVIDALTDEYADLRARLDDRGVHRDWRRARRLRRLLEVLEPFRADAEHLRALRDDLCDARELASADPAWTREAERFEWTSGRARPRPSGGDEAAVRVTVWPEAEPRETLRNEDIRIDLLCLRVPNAPTNLLITHLPSGISCPGRDPSPRRAHDHALRVVLARLWAAEAGPGHPTARYLEHSGKPVVRYRLP